MCIRDRLTGSNQHVGNFPGVTVDKKEGSIRRHPEATVTDLPGIYSLSPLSLIHIYTDNGYDAVEYEISTNPGERRKPLGQIVSGGELSRIMLAIKAILADKDQIDTLIFDEIDTGISGRTAQKVSEKMAVIGQHRQVLCITPVSYTHLDVYKRQV